MSVDTVGWLLDGDPAIRWQVMRDLLGEHEDVWRTEQRKVATEGWGARLLAHRDGIRWTPKLYGQKWISTTYTLLQLRQLGLPAHHVRESCLLFLDEEIWAQETCINGFAVGLLAWAGTADERPAGRVLAEQMDDGGWNCQRHRGATHSSFHTTINVLDGLRDHGGHPEAEQRGREFLLAHHLYQSHRTGDVVDPKMLRFVFPPRWRYDVLRALDHFQAARAPRDPRLTDAIELLRSRRSKDGRWAARQPHPGQVWFEMEQPGEPSRWNTLRALRVLNWWSTAE